MEKAACAVLADVLENGQTTVGTAVNIEHTAATPIGMKVTATAVISSVNGRKITFDVSVSDEAGSVGTGTHSRVIVDERRFMDRAIEKGKSIKG